MNRFLVSIALAIAFGSSVQARPGAFDHSVLDRILRENVREERVDYLAVRKRDAKDLVAYLDRIATTDPATLPKDEQLALYVNLYNATMIRAVVERYRAGYSPAEKDFGVFNEPLVRVGGKSMSLNDLENKVVRPTFNEPRIHVALVCGARSCPPILARAYRADDLDATLEANMKRFVNDTARNPIDASRKELRLSQLFNWYAADFGGPDKVSAYVDKYHPADVGSWKPSFVDYSWDLNSAPPKEGRFAIVTAMSTDLRKGSPTGERVGKAEQREVFEVLEEKDGWYRVDRGLGAGEAWVQASAMQPFGPKQ